MTIKKSLLNTAKTIIDYAVATALIIYDSLTLKSDIIEDGFCYRTYDNQGNLFAQVESSPFSPDATVSTRQLDGKFIIRKEPKRPDLTWRISTPSLAPTPKNNNLQPHYNPFNTRH